MITDEAMRTSDARSEGAAVPEAVHGIAVADIETLRARGSMVVKQGRKQIALFWSNDVVYACNNRCPHEGYPLIEGDLSHGCVLTCNWHNWKFDLESGETLVGSDRLRRYPVRLADGKVWLDLTDPPAGERAEAALAALHDAFERQDRFREYERMARELARFIKAGGDPLDAVRRAIVWAHDRLEFGTSHAIAAAADWLRLRAWKAGGDPVRGLVPLTEIIGHLAWDSLRQPSYPFPEGTAAYEPMALAAAIEAEDEARAIAQLRGALAAGLGFAELEAPLAEAALAHYADFGHSAIYVTKTGQLIGLLGRQSEEPLLLCLVRSLVYAFREDLIPEFRAYGRALEAWPQAPAANATPPRAEDFIGLSVRAALERSLAFAADPAALYRALLGAAAWNLLHFDQAVEAANDRPVQDNVGWLDYTHAITFANAVRNLCERHPRLWPQGLLQMACFLGRNTPYVDRGLKVETWRVSDAEVFLDATADGLLDHGQFEYIVAAHLLKTFMAAREEARSVPQTPGAPHRPETRSDLLAGINRLLNTPIKRKFTLRTARQSLEFVARED